MFFTLVFMVKQFVLMYASIQLKRIPELLVFVGFFLLWFFVVAVVGWLVEFDFDLLCFFPDKTFPKWKQ